MSFNATVPLLVKDLEKRIDDLYYKIRQEEEAIRNIEHDCNCEECTISEDAWMDDSDVDDIQIRIDDMKSDLPLLKDTLERLKVYAKDKNIQLEPSKQ